MKITVDIPDEWLDKAIKKAKRVDKYLLESLIQEEVRKKIRRVIQGKIPTNDDIRHMAVTLAEKQDWNKIVLGVLMEGFGGEQYYE